MRKKARFIFASLILFYIRTTIKLKRIGRPYEFVYKIIAFQKKNEFFSISYNEEIYNVNSLKLVFGKR